MVRMIEWIVSSSALLAVLIALRQLWKGRISLRLQYALWGLALLRLLIPFSFGSTAFSVQNALPQQQMKDLPYTAENAYFAYETRFTITTDTDSRSYDVPGQWREFNADQAALEQSGEKWSVSAQSKVVTMKFLALMIWIAGMAAVTLCLLGSNLHFGRKLRRSRRLLTKEGALPLYLTEEADTPCLFGLFRPAVYVTTEAAEEPARLRHVVEHELTHYRHGDQFWSLLRGLCLVLHWYNPLVWWAAFLSRRDGELACDESTIARLGEEERLAYGRTLIDMTCAKRPALLVTATTMTGSKGGIRERIALIAKRPKTVAAALMVLLLTAAIAVGCTFTGGKKQEKPQPTEAPTAAPATAVPSAVPVPTPKEGPAAEAPESILFLPTDSTDYETVARDYTGAYVGQFIQTAPDSPYKADDAMVDTRVMEVREDGEAFIFQAHIGFAPAEPDRFGAVMGAGNGSWNEEEKRFYVWRYFCLEKADGGWTGVDLDVLDYYSEYTAIYGDYFASVPNPRADKAIREAAIAYNRDSHTEGEVSCESHVLVAKESAPGSGGTTVETYYLMILYQAYDWVDGAPKAVSGSYIPSALTFEVSPEGEYALLEYWTPRDSPFYWDDLRAKFPADVPDEDLNDQNPKYLERVLASNDAQARAYFAASREPTDGWFLDMAWPMVEEYCRRTGRFCPEEGTVVRCADGVSVDVIYPIQGRRYSFAVTFTKGEDGNWAPAEPVSFRVITDGDLGYAELRLDLGERTVPEAVAQYALEVAQRELDYYERDVGYVFDEAKVTAITYIDTGTVGLWEGYNLYRVEWRFRPAAGQEIMLAGGMTMEDGWLTEWGSGGQPYILMGWRESNGVESWERICVTNTDVIETEYGTPEMLEKYGNAYTAAAVELRAKARGRHSLADPRGLTVFSPSSSPLGIGEDWAKAYAERLTQVPEVDPCYCRSMEVRSCELYAESLLSEPKQFIYIMRFACDPADKTAFTGQLVSGGYDTEHPDWLSFSWFVVLEADLNGGWECADAGTGGYGMWGWLNYGWNTDELLDRMVTEQVGGEDALMLLPLIDWSDFDRRYKFGEETWNALWKKIYEACVGEGRYYDLQRSQLWSDVYFYDQLYRDMYVILGFLHADGAYAEGLAEILKEQYANDPIGFEHSLTFFPEQQQGTVRKVLGEVDSITLNRTDFTLSRIGEQYRLQATVQVPAGVTVTVSWLSLDPAVATVDENGTVTAVDHGTTKIIASVGGASAECTVRVSAYATGGTP